MLDVLEHGPQDGRAVGVGREVTDGFDADLCSQVLHAVLGREHNSVDAG